MNHDTIQAVSAAIAAFRANGNTVINRSVNLSNNNLALITAILNKEANAIPVSDEDRAEAVTVIDFYKHQQVMYAITGKAMTEFVYYITMLCHTDTLKDRDLSYIAWAPHLHVTMQKQQETADQLSVLSYGSKYLGKYKDKVELTFVTIHKRYNKHYQAWRYTGHDTHGNLVGFFSNQDFGSQVNIKGSIKSTETSKFNAGGKTTYLSHVRELK